MPFNTTAKAIIGPDALTPLGWARGTFCEWLAGKLNDPNGPYAALLGLTADRPAFVLESQEIVKAMYGREDSPPVVSLFQGPQSSREWRKFIAGTTYNGERIETEWMLDMGIRDATPTDDDVEAERRDDSNLAGFVRDVIKNNMAELDALGLFALDIEPDTEKQRAGQWRHPHTITLFLRTLHDYNPVP